MTRFRSLGVGLLALLFASHPAHAQSGPHYRDYQLGGNVASTAALAGVAASDAKVVQQRLALIQNLQWRRPYSMSDVERSAADPVQQIVFSFYNDQLFRLTIDYDSARVKGMTDADIINAISAMYGTTVKPTVKPSRMSTTAVEEESGTPIARWGDSGYSAVLYRSSYESGFRLIVTSIPLETLAHTATEQAARLEAREAPQREIARQKKDADDTKAARDANKSAFRP